jgi:hypothetical protein
MPHSIIAVQYNAVDAIVTAVQKVLVNVAQPICHACNITQTAATVSTASFLGRLLAES